MNREIVVGNGQLLAGFDVNYQLRELYFPHPGDRNHIGISGSHFILGDGTKFASTLAPSYRIRVKYLKETLCTSVSLANNVLQLVGHCSDTVDYQFPILIRRIQIRNLVDYARTISIYHHQNFHIVNPDSSVGTQAYYDKASQSMVHFSGRRSLAVTFWNRFEPIVTSHQLELPEKLHEAMTLSESGPQEPQLFCQNQSFLEAQLRLDGFKEGELYLIIMAADSEDDLVRCRRALETIGPEEMVNRTAAYWKQWSSAANFNFGHLPNKVEDLFKRSLLLIRSHIDDNGAVVTDFDIDGQGTPTQGFMNTSAAIQTASALDLAEQADSAKEIYRRLAVLREQTSGLADRYRLDGNMDKQTVSDNDLPVAIRNQSALLHALRQHYSRYRDTEFFRTFKPNLIDPIAEWLTGCLNPATSLPLPGWDLWRKQIGIDIYSVCALWAGLRAAHEFAVSFGDTERASRYTVLADKLKFTIEQRFYHPEQKRFVRMIVPGQGRENFTQDLTLDCSLFSLVHFGVLEVDDPRMIATATAVSDQLWVKTPVGGLARFQGDVSMYSADSVPQDIPGDPCVYTTLWMAENQIARAQTVEEIKQAIPVLEWAVSNAGRTGFFSDILRPFPISEKRVRPSIESHAEFVIAVIRYLEKLENLHRCEKCGQPVYQTRDSEVRSNPETVNPSMEGIVCLPHSQQNVTVTIDLRECLGCGLCVIRCREKVLTLLHHKVQVDPERTGQCDLCLVCENACPTGAIHFIVSGQEAEKLTDPNLSDTPTSETTE